MAKDRDHGGYADSPSTFGGRDPEPPIPGAKFGRLRDEFDRVAAKAEARAGSRASEAEANPFRPDAPLLPGVVRLVRTAARCAEEHGTDYANRTKHEPSSLAPASFMHTLSMVLDTAADVLDELVRVDEKSRGE